MKESTLAKLFLPKWQKENGKDSYLCRNNTGGYKKGNNWIIYGIGLVKQFFAGKRKITKVVGGGDYIGWTTKTLCELIADENGCCTGWSCQDCSAKTKKVAIFTSVELKTKGVYPTEDQIEWMNKVNNAGGIAFVHKEGEGN